MLETFLGLNNFHMKVKQVFSELSLCIINQLMLCEMVMPKLKTTSAIIKDKSKVCMKVLFLSSQLLKLTCNL